MRNVVRPIAFDQTRMAMRRNRSRVAQQKRRAKQFEFGGEWYLPSFMQRMVREPWDITVTADDGNDNFERRNGMKNERRADFVGAKTLALMAQANKDHPETEHTGAGGWCKHCGCGNDVLGYKHLPNCNWAR